MKMWFISQQISVSKKDKAQVKIRKKKMQSTAEINFKYTNSIDNKIMQ